MASQTTITITHQNEVTADLKTAFQPTSERPKRAAELLRNQLERMASGLSMGTISMRVDDGDGVAATGTISFSSLANNDTITVGGVTFTAKTSGAAGASQFNLGASDSAAATNAAAAINAHTSLTDVVTASASSNVITVSCVRKGLIGNYIGIAISAHGSVSGALLTGGTNSANPTTVSYSYGV